MDWPDQGRDSPTPTSRRLDDQVGEVLQALQESGAAEDTTVIYTSDHGDMAGNRGLWAKSYMYEDSVGIPMIVAGPGFGAGAVSDNPVNLIDVHPTVMDLIGLEAVAPSLAELASTSDSDRVTFSEYHDGGSTTGFYLVRSQRWKYVYYVGHSPELYDLDTDPDEVNDLGNSSGHQDERDWLHGELLKFCDPDVTSAEAFDSQRTLIAQLGGPEAIARRCSSTKRLRPASVNCHG